MEIEKILKQMTLEDKIALCSGASFWETKNYEKYGIPSMFLCDGPHGLRKQEREDGADMLGVGGSRPSTCFPAEVTTAGSWDIELLKEIGAAIGEEAKEQGVGLVLGPGANIKRNPLCGRNFEYFSEDPYLAGKLAAGFIRGAEGQGVGTSLKHFAANSQEKCRFHSDSVMDGRTLRELYLPAFEIAVKEGKPSSVMCAYPKLNGIHCSDHQELLTGILRDEWGFDGMVVTDWGAMNDRIEGFRAGCDLNMPGGSDYMEKAVRQAVRDGTLPESCIDASARRVLKLVFRAAETLREKSECDYDAHHALACRAAEQGAVLLKNDEKILPLKQGAKIAVIGEMAKNMRFQGAGSSHINPIRISQPLDFLPGVSYASGCDDRGNTTDALLAEAAEAAKNAEIAVVFAGLPDRYESEGFDRESMQMPEGHIRMIETAADANPNTVVVLLCGCVVECPWADQVKAILYMGLPGQAGGEAIANLLYGKANPCGKTGESWPIAYGDVPSSEIYGKTKDALYQEGIYVGYRYYDKAGAAVRWPFGYGLSYTSFAYSDLEICGNTVSVTVKNTGKYFGAEIIQLYLAPPQEGLHRPVREMKGFRKVFLQPGESRRAAFELDDRAFALWKDGWKVSEGSYTIHVGGLSAVIEKKGEEIPAPAWQEGSWYETCQGKPSKKQWEAMLGRAYVPPKLRKGQFTMDNTVEEMKEFSFIMKIMYKAVEKTVARGFGGKADYENPEFRMMMASSAGAPLRSMQISGGMKGGVMTGLLEMANGHFLRGIGKILYEK
ncbi:MAG: beta-glucosidase [Eubacteriales bacterium]|nr:beta-glucosidase [Eubacteriales bacterium]